LPFNTRTARAASHRSWSKTVDRDQRTLPGREAARAKLEGSVDPDGLMTPETRRKAIVNAKKDQMIRLSELGVAARRRKRAES
jgi:hypothetical protein